MPQTQRCHSVRCQRCHSERTGPRTFQGPRRASALWGRFGGGERRICFSNPQPRRSRLAYPIPSTTKPSGSTPQKPTGSTPNPSGVILNERGPERFTGPEERQLFGAGSGVGSEESAFQTLTPEEVGWPTQSLQPSKPTGSTPEKPAGSTPNPSGVILNERGPERFRGPEEP
jgi:hypothetical protein